MSSPVSTEQSPRHRPLPVAPGARPQPGGEPARPALASRLPTLTGLRFPAALLVFFFHSSLMFPNIRLFADTGLEKGYYATFAQAGGLGVTFFFVLSGFILAWSARPGDVARAFWRRRYVKIVPVYLVTWALAMVLVAGATTTRSQGLATFFMVQSWVPDVATYWGVNAPGWSLSDEVLFYLLFPVLFWAIKRIPAQRLKYWIGAVVAAVALTPLLTYAVIPQGTATVPNWPTDSANWFWFAYVFPPARLLDFALGILVARAVTAGRWRDIGMAWSGLLLVASYVAASFAPLLYGLRVLCVVPAALLIAAGATADSEGRFSVFRSRPMVWLGEVSFAFYLVHFTVLNYVRKLLGGQLFGTLPSAAILLGDVVISLLVSWALYAWVEKPLTRRWSRPARGRL